MITLTRGIEVSRLQGERRAAFAGLWHRPRLRAAESRSLGQETDRRHPSPDFSRIECIRSARPVAIATGDLPDHHKNRQNQEESRGMCLALHTSAPAIRATDLK